MKTQLSTQFASQKIDREKGIIFGVSVITEGEALGHGFKIDATTLAGVLSCASAFADGVRVKIEHGTGFESIVGTLRDFRIEGPQLRADLHLIVSHEKTPSILEMAEKMPGGFGLSIAFSGKSETIDGAKLARCSELYSVDLVDMPAANPGGLFSARVDSAQVDTMATATAEPKEGFIAALKEFFSPSNEANPVAKLETNLAAAQTEITKLKADLSQKDSDLATVKQSLATVTAEKDALKASIPAEVEKLASAKALEIAGKQGITAPIEIKGATETASTAAQAEIEAAKKLTGLAKVIALEKLGYKPTPPTKK